MFHLVQQCKIVQGVAPATNAGALTGDYISLRNAQACFVVVEFTQGNAAQSTIAINEATNNAGGGVQAVANSVRIWSNLNTAATDTLVRRANAVNYQLDVAVANKQVVFQVNPDALSAGFDHITCVVGASNAANIASVTYFIYNRYQQATPPSAI